MSHVAVTEYVNTRNFSARADNRTELRCPAKLGQVIGCGRCVEMQPTCGLADSCRHAHIAREANQQALAMMPTAKRNTSLPLPECLVCDRLVRRQRDRTCSAECSLSRRTAAGQFRGAGAGHIQAERRARIKKALLDGVSTSEAAERFGVCTKTAERIRRRLRESAKREAAPGAPPVEAA